MDDQTRQDIQNQIGAARDAQVELAKQKGALWEAQMNMALAAGDESHVMRLVHRLQEGFLDNCSCSPPPPPPPTGPLYLD
jgi:hypothetical protein